MILTGHETVEASLIVKGLVLFVCFFGDRPNNIAVYNCATGHHNPLTWGQIESLGRVALLKYPMSEVMWYPGGGFKSNLLVHKIDVVLYHYLPAYFLDFLARLSGRPPMLVTASSKVDFCNSIENQVLVSWSRSACTIKRTVPCPV